MGGDWGGSWGGNYQQKEKQKREFDQMNPGNYTQDYWKAVNAWGVGNDKLTADRSADTLLAEDMTRKRALAGSPLVRGAQQSIADILAGKNFDPNFNTAWSGAADKLKKTYQDITLPSIDTRFSLAGRTGSGAASSAYGKASEGLGTSLSDLASNIYNTERQRELIATQMAPSLAGEDYKDIGALNAVGANQEAYNQKVLDAKAGKLKTWGGLIQPGLGLSGSTTTTSTSGGGNPLSQLLGLYMQNPKMWNNMLGQGWDAASSWFGGSDTGAGYGAGGDYSGGYGAGGDQSFMDYSMMD